MSQDKNLNRTIVMANAVGQIGCVTALAAIVIIAISYGLGSLIDNLAGLENNIFTVFFMLGSFPVTLYAITRISLSMVVRAQRQAAALEESAKTVSEEEK